MGRRLCLSKFVSGADLSSLGGQEVAVQTMRCLSAGCLLLITVLAVLLSCVLQIVLLGVCLSRRPGGEGEDLTLQPLPSYSLPSDNVIMTSVATR